MNEAAHPACPHCGSRHLVTHLRSRKVFIDPQGERIPLLTVHFSLGSPIIEESSTTFTCACSWAGKEDELVRVG